MKYIFFLLMLVSLNRAVFSYTARMTLILMQNELKVQAEFSFESNSERLTMPGRARLINISSITDGTVNFYQNGHVILIDNVISTYGGKINVAYSLPITSQEFYSDNWLVRPDEKGSINTAFTLPEGFKGLIFPYEEKKGDGFLINPDENPLLICGRYIETMDKARDRSYDVYYHGRSQSTISDIDHIIEAYENLLFGLDQKSIIIINLPAIPGMVRFEKNNIFLITGGSTLPEIKYAAVRLWFRGLLKFEGSELFAYTDLYTRLIDDNGNIRNDQAFLVPVPSHSYYENILKNGFTTKGELNCNVSDMLRNVSMLHFAVFTAGISSYTNYVKTFVAGKRDALSNSLNSQGLPDICASSGADESVVAVAKYFLPFAARLPGISIKLSTAFRNMDEIPDISALVNGEKIKIGWNGKRSFDINATNGIIILDPDRIVPQLNFENCISVLDPHEALEWEAAREAAVKHKHYSGESSRNILYLEKYEYPSSTSFDLVPGSSVFVAIVRIFAPVNGKLQEGLKEIIITVKNGKALAVEERIRL